MLFNSWEFLILCIITFLLYYCPLAHFSWGKAWQVWLLLLASAVFYGWNDPRLLPLLFLSCIGNAVATTQIIRYQKNGNSILAKRTVAIAVVINLLLLAVFKYAVFFCSLIPGVPDGIIAKIAAIPLPIGISFYTFHGISMIIDVSRGELRHEKQAMVNSSSFSVNAARNCGLYLLFFPQLVAGPIVKAKQFFPQIGVKVFRDIDWKVVFRATVTGYFLKMVVADNLAENTVGLTQPWLALLGPVDLIALLFAYGMQIFSDFAGYSLIAIGMAALFGYKFPDNFNFPYLATSITEFWKRWHMSLSSWLRDYLYIPLGGNRKGSARTYVNLIIVMFLGGLWHGAEWKFVLWGCSHGVLLALERACAPLVAKFSKSRLSAALGWCYTYTLVNLLWLTFLMPDLHQIRWFFSELQIWQNPKPTVMFNALLFGSIPVLYHLYGWLREHKAKLAASCQGGIFEGLIYGSMIFLIITNSGAPQGFIYFQF